MQLLKFLILVVFVADFQSLVFLACVYVCAYVHVLLPLAHSEADLDVWQFYSYLIASLAASASLCRLAENNRIID